MSRLLRLLDDAATVFLAAVLCGCASSPLAPRTAAQILDYRADGGSDLQMTLHAIVVPDGAGSMVREAEWDEYHLTLRNAGPAPLRVESIDVVEPSGHAMASTTNLDELREKTGVLQQRAVAVGAVTAGTAAAGSAAYSLAGGATMYSGLLAATIVMPIALAGGITYFTMRGHNASEKVRLSQAHIGNRGLVVPLDILPGDEVEGIAFFPAGSPAAMLVARYAAGGASASTAIALGEARAPSNPPAH